MDPVTSHIPPHHVILRGALAQKSGWDRRSDHLIGRIVEQQAGVDKATIMASLGIISVLGTQWLKQASSYQYRSATRWLDPQSAIIDDLQSSIGHHFPRPESTCGWWSDAHASISTHSDDEEDEENEEEEPRAALPGVIDIDRDSWIREWVHDTKKAKMHHSYQVILTMLWTDQLLR
jgi:hypothetical protein